MGVFSLHREKKAGGLGAAVCNLESAAPTKCGIDAEPPTARGWAGVLAGVCGGGTGTGGAARPRHLFPKW